MNSEWKPDITPEWVEVPGCKVQHDHGDQDWRPSIDGRHEHLVRPADMRWALNMILISFLVEVEERRLGVKKKSLRHPDESDIYARARDRMHRVFSGATSPIEMQEECDNDAQ